MVCITLPTVFALLFQTVDVRRFILRNADALKSSARGIDVVGEVLLTEDLWGLAHVWPPRGLLLTAQVVSTGTLVYSALEVELVGLVLLWANTILVARTKATTCSV
jgi:heme exporter protein D